MRGQGPWLCEQVALWWTILAAACLAKGASANELLLSQNLPQFTIDAILRDSNSSQAHAFRYLSTNYDHTVIPQWRRHQILALATVYYSLNGDGWDMRDRQNWLNSTYHECDWAPTIQSKWRHGGEDDVYQVECTPEEERRLTSLQLSFFHHRGTDRRLLGSLPKEMRLLSSLETLSVSESGWTGRLESLLPWNELARMTNLKSLESNGYFNRRYSQYHNISLSGALPSALGLLTALTRISLKSNFLTGSLPTQIALLRHDLTDLALYDNLLTGTVPTELAGLSNLMSADLEKNQLNGTVPIEVLVGLQRMAGSLNLGRNNFTGTIPSEIGLMVEPAQLGENHLTGTLPTQIGLLTSATYLQFSSNQLTGTIPTQLGLLAQSTNLKGLFLSGNQLEGTLPSELGLLSQMTNLHFKENKFTGTIPTVLGQMKNLTYLALSSNTLSGTIPSQLGRLTAITWFGVQLDHNSLRGRIPTQLGYLTALRRRLWLQNNRLTGPIPSQLGALTMLSDLDLQDNFISGAIPSELGLMNRLTLLKLADNPLMGTVPAGVCELDLEGYGIQVDCRNGGDVVCPMGCRCNCTRPPPTPSPTQAPGVSTAVARSGYGKH